MSNYSFVDRILKSDETPRPRSKPKRTLRPPANNDKKIDELLDRVGLLQRDFSRLTHLISKSLEEKEDAARRKREGRY